MITLTDKAAKHLKSIMASWNNPMGIRINITDGGCSGFHFSLTEAVNGTFQDKIFTDKDIKLFVDQKCFLYVDGTEIDYSDDLNSMGFIYNNPRFKRKCGCGSSFSV